MGRVLLKCKLCSKFFATGMNVASTGAARRMNKFDDIPYRCTNCGEESEYGSADLVDEGPELGGQNRRQGA